MSVVQNSILSREDLVLLGTQSGQAWLPLVSFLSITDVVERASTTAKKKKALRGLKGSRPNWSLESRVTLTELDQRS